MRILYFSRDYTTHDHRFLDALSQTSHQIFYLRLERGAHNLEDRPVPAGVTLIPWVGGQGPARLSAGPRLLASLLGVIRKFKPDLIHVGPLQTAGLLTALAGFHPFVAVSWGYDLLQDANRSGLWRRATRFTLKRADAFLGDCETIRQRAIAFGMAPDRIVTFPWGVDLKKFNPSKKVVEPRAPGEPAADPARNLRTRLGWEDGFVLLSTRGWEPVYGTLDLARAFAQAAAANPALRMIMLGAGSQAQAIRRAFLQGGVLDRVHFGGQVGQDHLPAYFQSADLYVSASYSDGTSISLLEALASGLPALVSDIPGNQEWITPGQTGWTFPAGEVPVLAGAIQEAVESQTLLAEMGKNARALAEERADWDQNFPKLFEAYEIALTRSGVQAGTEGH